MNTFRTRQAPSPTGYLHFGTARTMLFTKLFTLKNKGVYYLRLEDTDRNRLDKMAALGLVNNLKTLGLDPDEGVTLEKIGQMDEFYNVYQSGDFGPYIQSQRLNLYHEYAQKLIDKGLAYWSYLTSEDKNELQKLKQVMGRSIDYWQACNAKTENKLLFQSVKKGLLDSNKPALMYKLQRKENIHCKDLLLGETDFDLTLEEDFVILKSDGFPTYHLAHLVDDYLMKTSMVIRSQEWYPSLPKHATMFLDCYRLGIFDREYMSWENNYPDYIHVPFILGETGSKKMSKRDGNVNMADYLASGYLPEAIINYLAFLGWNPGTEKELYLGKIDFDTLIEETRLQKLITSIADEFDLSKLSKSPARFSIEKLNWFNREYIKLITYSEWFSLAKLYYKPDLDTENIQTQLALILDKNRITTLSEFGLESSCILDWKKPEKSDINWRKTSLPESLENLKEITTWLLENSNLSIYFASEDFLNWNKNSAILESEIKKWLQETEKDTGSYLWPLRVALSGKTKSPSPFEILAILNVNQIKNRIDTILN
jgi:glutamyl-tRNA synthetase